MWAGSRPYISEVGSGGRKLYTFVISEGRGKQEEAEGSTHVYSKKRRIRCMDKKRIESGVEK